MDYSLRELECFLAVAEERSFTRAARRLNLAQPPLSRHVRLLEEKIGARLFVREPRGVALTTAGAAFFEETRRIPLRLARAGEIARRCAAGETARLRLGFVSAVMNADLLEIFREFRAAHPSIQILPHDLPPQDQLRALADGLLDGGFVGMEPEESHPGLRFVPWRSEALMAFLPTGHRLAGQGELNLADLAADPFVAVSSESAPAFSRHWRGLCARAGFKPRVILESPRAQAVAVMVGADSGVAVLPAGIADLVRGQVAAVPLAGGPAITHVFALAGRESAALAAFVSRLGHGR